MVLNEKEIAILPEIDTLGKGRPRIRRPVRTLAPAGQMPYGDQLARAILMETQHQKNCSYDLAAMLGAPGYSAEFEGEGNSLLVRQS